MSSRAGNALENRVRDDLTSRGYFAMCGRASRGPADVLAVAAGRVTMVVQVKGDKVSPWANFRTADRVGLREAARQTGGVAWLVWCPTGKGMLQWFAEGTWPS